MSCRCNCNAIVFERRGSRLQSSLFCAPSGGEPDPPMAGLWKTISAQVDPYHGRDCLLERVLILLQKINWPQSIIKIKAEAE